MVRIGEVLAGKYRVERVLGTGGMGVVVAARHLELGQRVALKLLLPEGLDDAATVERFAREARAAARLESEHAVRVLDVGRLKDGAPFLVMEYLDGEDLGALLDRVGRVEISEAVDLVLQAMEAIAEAHGIGIVHRDIKPRNLFLTRRRDGRRIVKVLDFGLAKVLRTNDPKLTATSTVMGSPQYMSPEQMKGAGDVGLATDVWSLGVCLYELIAGRVPFDGATMPELFAAVLTDAPAPLEAVRPDVPVELARAVHRCLEKDAKLRTESVAELARAIEPFGSTASAGMALRIEAFLSSAPVISEVDTKATTKLDERERTAAAWESDSASRRRTRGIAIGIGGAMAALALVVLVLLARSLAPAHPVTSRAASETPAPSIAPPVREPQPSTDNPLAPIVTDAAASVAAPLHTAAAPRRSGKPDGTKSPPLASSAPAHAF
jgi:serine/threonine-protein kinase